MTLDSTEIITRRLLRELNGVSSVILGEGIPALVKTLLPAGTRLYTPGQTPPPGQAVDAAVFEAVEVSDKGDLVLPEHPHFNGVRAGRWIVATHHTHLDGEPKLVRQCQLPVSVPACVGLVITELGVIEISDVGLVLQEVAPGVGTDDVKMRTRASLHIADDIRLMEL